jgi:hypothetical protein
MPPSRNSAGGLGAARWQTRKMTEQGEAKDTVSMNKILENIEVPIPCLLTYPNCHQQHKYTLKDLRWLEEPAVLEG